METLNAILQYLAIAGATTLKQLAWLFGLLFIFGFLLYLLARFTRTSYVKTIGSRFDIVFTGWIGTPVHELGHAIFCILFRHKIVEIKLFAPNSEDGTLGYVKHSYDTSSIYQKVGNFFIGIGPILFGTIVLYALLYFLVPNSETIFNYIRTQSQTLAGSTHGEFNGVPVTLWETSKHIFASLFSASNFSDYRFWIFLYASICVASHMELSPPDIKGAWKGLLILVLVFLFINLIIIGTETLGYHQHLGKWWQYIKLESYTSAIDNFVGISGALFVFASIVSGINFLFSYILLTIINLVRKKGFVNPAW